MTFYESMIELKDNLLKIRDDFGDPRLRTVVFQIVHPVNPEPFVFMTRKLTVTTPPSKIIGLPLDSRGVFIVSYDDYYLKNIPRSIDKESLNGICWIDANFDYPQANATPHGIRCRIHFVDDSKGLSYDIIARKELEQTMV